MLYILLKLLFIKKKKRKKIDTILTVKTFTIKKMTFSVVISAFVFTQTTSIKIQLNCLLSPSYW